ncbi:MAG: glycosyltransferase family 4 protein [Novosphingobium sp.]|nr:glycosyltransferase family 4 protein [Novosphingobium sp.]
MRILVSDYSGHPFQVQLSRELARRGHSVRHTYSAKFQTPKGNLKVAPDDPSGFEIVPVSNKRPFEKGTFFARRQQEIEIGEALAEQVADFRPDVVLSSNAPLDTQRIFQRAAIGSGACFLFWLQDIYSEAISRVVPRKFPVIGTFVAAWYRWLEFTMLRKSDGVIAITEDFVPILKARGVPEERIAVIENWAPLDELQVQERDNPWSATNMARDGLRIVYSGTLGYKHNPGLLLALARRLPQANVHVFSEGEVADKLARDALAEGTTNLTVHPWVAFADLPCMLSAADIFVAVIEPEAGVYSVPSKILTYLAIGRPVLASVPEENLAARLLLRNEAGQVANPGDEKTFLDAAERLAADETSRIRLGDNGRAYAGRTFDISNIGDRFVDFIDRIRRS